MLKSFWQIYLLTDFDENLYKCYYYVNPNCIKWGMPSKATFILWRSFVIFFLSDFMTYLQPIDLYSYGQLLFLFFFTHCILYQFSVINSKVKISFVYVRSEFLVLKLKYERIGDKSKFIKLRTLILFEKVLLCSSKNNL